ncbi:GTPase [Streptomyces rubradiris]|uniref:ATP-binding protein n=1 Tax=Streptomyces rubradiris TaxID=285531 RepID=A0ABQ3RP90_STRRR|nr:GTPase [Streptomyces rubradiris]GHH12064.1 ATP-binding protein [Streptomyces rubradiris]GHI57665.1 ATP-binding protein [Streptomyces rubradiris]
MTAVTDQDHTEHTDHMRRTDSGSGDTGSLEHVGRAATGAPDTAERVGGLAHASLSLVKEGPGDDGPGTGGRYEGRGDDATEDGNGGGHEGGGGGCEGDGAGVRHARVPDETVEGGPDTGREERPARVRDENADRVQGDGADRERSGDADRDRGRSIERDGHAGEDGHRHAVQDRDGHAVQDRDRHGARDHDRRGAQDHDRLGAQERDRHGEAGGNGDRDRSAHGRGTEQGVSVPRPHPHPARSPKPRTTPGATPPKTATAAGAATPTPTSATDGEAGAAQETWDDGLIARRVTGSATAERTPSGEQPHRGPGAQVPVPLAYDGPLRSRLNALRELVGLSRTRLDSHTLAEAGRVLDEAAARRKLSGRHTVVALAGATGSGKSQLFNSLAGVAISETGVRRPTTAAPIACSWSDGAATLIDRLGIPGRLRRRPMHSPDNEAQLRGLVLVDLPDHDSAAVQHREQVDRILKLVDAVIWVVDPEKYADAMLHERYLRPMAGHAEVMFIVLNQVDRLPGDAADQVLDDLRRLLDEDGIALGEHGEPGATVLALSALTGEGVGELREALGQFVAERGAAARRVAADLDAAAAGLRPVYATGRRAGLTEEAREEFAARLADAVGATAAGEAAERAWLRNANRACGTPWLRLWRWYQGRGEATTGRHAVRGQADEEATARQRVEQAVRTVADRASAGLPAPWAQAVREAAVRGSQGLSEALDALSARAGLPPGRPPRPGWWPVAVLVQAAMTLLQIVGGGWLAGQIAGLMAPNLGVPVLLMVCGIVGGPLVEWGCRMAARGPARRYGQEAERRLREAAAGCGRARVLDPVAAELLRYREVREQYGRVARSRTGVG